MAKYLSGRSKRRSQSGLTSDRYQYLGVNQAEPNLGDPTIGISSVGFKTPPPGQQYQIVSVASTNTNYPGERYWVPVGGGLIPGAISVFEENSLVGSLSSITQLKFFGNSITASAVPLDILATITVAPPGNDGSVLFKESGDFATSSGLVFNSSVGILTAGNGLVVGTGGTILNVKTNGLIGIGTTNPTQELDINGDLRLRGTIYDYNNQPGSNAQILVKNNFGGVTWVNQDTVRAGAGGTITNIQYHNNAGLVDGAPNFVFDYTNNRVGIGSTLPEYLLDVRGYSRFIGQTEIDYLRVTGLSTIATLGVGGLTTTRNLKVIGISTFDDYIDANGGAYIDNVQIGITNDNTIDTNTGNLTIGSAGGTTIVTGITSVGFITARTGYVGFLTVGELNVDKTNLVNLSITGIATIGTLGVGGLTTTRHLNVIGVTTTDSLKVTGLTSTKDLYVTGIATFVNQVNTKNLNATGIATVGNIKLNVDTISTITGNLILDSDLGTTQINDAVYVNDTTQSTNKDTGSIITEGGVGIEKNLNVGGASSIAGITTFGSDILPYNNGTQNIGSLSKRWNNIYVDTLNGNIIGYASSIAVELDSTNTTRYIPFVDSTVGLTTVRTDDLLVFNPSTNSLGIGTTNPGEKLQVDGNIRVGISTTSNYIAFRGTYGDGVNASGGDQPGYTKYTHTFIGERIYDYSGAGERSELLLFKGNDSFDVSSGTVGPDRIRLASGEFRFDTIGFGHTEGTFEEVGVSTFITNKMILTGAGNLGIGSTNPTSKLWVNGDGYFTGVVTAITFSGNTTSATYATSAGIATYATSAGIATYATRSGIATYATSAGIATYATSAGIATYATNAGIATNLNGGIASQIPYQFAPGITSFIANGSPGFILQSNGTSAPSWVDASLGVNVNSANIATYATKSGIATYATSAGIATYATSAGIATYATSAGIATYATSAGIATYATSAGIATYATNAGFSTNAGIATNLKGGIASQIPYQFASGITSFIPNGTSGYLLQSNGTSAPSWVNPSLGFNVDTANYSTSAGIATYATKSGIATYATSAGIATYATSAGIATYATSAGIATYATSAGIATYATNAGFSTNAGIATNLKGGIASQIPYQFAPGITSFIPNGTSGFVLQSNGTSAPSWVDASLGVNVNSANIATYAISAGIATYATTAGIATNAGIATYATSAGIATYATSAGIATYATNAGIATNLNGGIASQIPYQVSPGITSFIPNGTSGYILQSNGTSAPSWVNPAIGLVADTANRVGVGSTTVSGNYPIAFVDSNNSLTRSYEYLYTDESLYYNPTTNQIFVGNIKLGSILDTTDSTGALSEVITADGLGGWSWKPTGISTYATNAGIATNLKGGIASQIPYQFASGITSFIPNGTSGYLLQSNGTSAPSWVNPSLGFNVDTANYSTKSGIATYATSAGIATYATSAGIATYATSAGIATYVSNAGFSTNAGIATNLKGGIASQIPYQFAPGITSFIPNGTSGYLLQSNGTSAPSWVNPSLGFNVDTANYSTSSGIATYATNAGFSTNAGIATNLKGGIASQIPYQFAPGITSFIPNGTSGFVLQSNGTSAPSWVNPAIGLVADTANRIGVGTTTVSGNYPITFVNSNNSVRDYEYLYTDESLSYNPTSNQIVVSNIKPNSITDSTDSTGTANQVITADGSGGWAWQPSGIGPSNIVKTSNLNLTQSSSLGSVGHTTTAYGSTSLSLTFTPRSTTSFILITVSIPTLLIRLMSTGPVGVNYQLRRTVGLTTTVLGTYPLSINTITAPLVQNAVLAFSTFDQPNTTSAVKYEIFGRSIHGTNTVTTYVFSSSVNGISFDLSGLGASFVPLPGGFPTTGETDSTAVSNIRLMEFIP
jgi:hypothetical protein